MLIHDNYAWIDHNLKVLFRIRSPAFVEVLQFLVIFSYVSVVVIAFFTEACSFSGMNLFPVRFQMICTQELNIADLTCKKSNHCVFSANMPG